MTYPHINIRCKDFFYMVWSQIMDHRDLISRGLKIFKNLLTTKLKQEKVFCSLVKSVILSRNSSFLHLLEMTPKLDESLHWGVKHPYSFTFFFKLWTLCASKLWCSDKFPGFFLGNLWPKKSKMLQFLNA